jgi:spore germination protein GerM
VKRLIAFAIALLLLPLCACQGRQQEQLIQLYFASADQTGPAIVGEPYTGGGEPSAEDLLRALLAGPNSTSLRSPFPAGLSLRGCTLEDGLLTVDFSEQYGGLTDISLTMADYCVVLTVCQLEGVETVEITAAGQAISYRSHAILTPEEAMLAVEE